MPNWYPLIGEIRDGVLHLLRPNAARGTRCNEGAYPAMAAGMTEDEAKKADRKLCPRCLTIWGLWK